ncbi:6573_t:CDS:2 [Paraglomus occultum]|uniref:6573_t:CDS:1 n=1 Tax=Paraglomus occultum TaxID=144539 RepID=A0A9N9EWI6_9GLOM|nr:6573_t:CDS:2 [Paraglomus occultum]
MSLRTPEYLLNTLRHPIPAYRLLPNDQIGYSETSALTNMPSMKLEGYGNVGSRYAVERDESRSRGPGRRIWSHSETKYFLSVMRKYYNKVTIAPTNNQKGEIWDKVVEEHNKYFAERTKRSCQQQWDRLIGRYRSAKGPLQFEYGEEMRSIIGDAENQQTDPAHEAHLAKHDVATPHHHHNHAEEDPNKPPLPLTLEPPPNNHAMYDHTYNCNAIYGRAGSPVRRIRSATVEEEEDMPQRKRQSTIERLLGLLEKHIADEQDRRLIESQRWEEQMRRMEEVIGSINKLTDALTEIKNK